MTAKESEVLRELKKYVPKETMRRFGHLFVERSLYKGHLDQVRATNQRLRQENDNLKGHIAEISGGPTSG